MKLYLILIILNLSLAEKSAIEERHLSRQKRLLFPQYTTLQVAVKIIFNKYLFNKFDLDFNVPNCTSFTIARSSNSSQHRFPDELSNALSAV